MANDARGGSGAAGRSGKEIAGSSKSNVVASTSNMKRGIRVGSNPSPTRRSERLEKRRPEGAAERGRSLSPVIEFEEVKSGGSSVSSIGAEKLRSRFNPDELSSLKKRKEKSVNQLTEVRGKDNRGNEHVLQPGRVGKKVMDARTYKALWTPQTKKKLFVQDEGHVLKVSDVSSKEDDNPCTTGGSDQVDQGFECTKRKEQEPEYNEEKEMGLKTPCFDVIDNSCPILKTSTEKTLREYDNAELPPVSPNYTRDGHETKAREYTQNTMSSDSQSPEEGPPKGISNAVEIVLMQRTAADTLQPPEQLKPMSEKNAMKNNDGLEKCEDNTSGHNVDADPRLCSACSKRRRLSHNSAEEVCCCSVTLGQNSAVSFHRKERGELEGGKASDDTNELGSHREAQELPLDIHGDEACNTCFNCNLGGDLLCCEGKECKRSYHLHCVDPPLTYFPFGTWYCIGCVGKKIKSGVHLVSKGIESIWDARELDVVENKETQKQKQYYVKYKGLAHVHNRWMSEGELLREASLLVSEFILMSQVIKWKPEWSVPQRLLQKRQLISPKKLDEHRGVNNGECVDCQYEWLVKWCGLDYDQVTWELENSGFLNTPEAQSLKSAYENRHKAYNDSPRVKRKVSFVKLSEFPAGFPLESANNCLDTINKLREFWHKSQNAVLVEESDRMMKVILLIVSLVSSISHPVLIIASSNELLRWEMEFLQLAPSLNVVVYSGSKDVRQYIRTLETFDGQVKTTFQVLITTEEVMSEDLEVLVQLGWEVIIIDECQRSNAWVHFGHIKRLTTKIRILLVSWQLKETEAEYCNMLSLLDCHGGSIDVDSLKTISSHDPVSLKNKISRYIVQEFKPDSLKFVEYWVPAQTSNVQLEQYCAALLSNVLSLCSSSKKDTVDALNEIIIRNRKCCDHPYIVDPSVQETMLKSLPVTECLDVGIKASGKLELLDSMLSEIKNRGLRVLILFQSIVGFGKNAFSIGDILDDYMRERFGPESYERIDVLHPKKQAALDKFNNEESGRFVLLLEARASGSSIKLASIDAVIIYGSDWIPTHDFRNLQKISFKSQYDQIKVFRLYTSHTLEEKVLLHVKHNMILDSIHSMFRNTNHKLLMWGAISLFKRLEDFHSSNGQCLETSVRTQNTLLKDVVKEFSAILEGCNSSGDCSIISTVEHDGSRYSSNTLLLGETEMGLSDGVLPHLYWTQLLEGKNPCWKYVSTSTQRNRKRVNYMDDTAKKLDVEMAEVSKKRKKVVKDQGYVELQNNIGKTCYGNREGRANMHVVQKSFHHVLQSEAFKLCKALQLSDDVKGMVEMFLAYVMTNHHVPDKPTSITQAFQIALCWIAASLLKRKLEHKASLAHAKEHFGYECTEEETERVYSKLRCLKSIFLFHFGYLKVADSSKTGNKNVPSKGQSLPFSCEHHMSKVEVLPLDKTLYDKRNVSQQQWESIVKMVERDVSRSLKKIEKKSSKQMSKLLRKQGEERKKMLAICEEDWELLEKSRKLDAAVVRFSSDTNVALREEELKSLDDVYKKRHEEHEKKKEMRLRYLDRSQLAARKKEEQKANSWVEEVNSWAHAEILEKLSDDFNKLPSACNIANQTRPDLIEFVEDVNEYTTIPETDTPGYVVCQDSTGISEVRDCGLNENLCINLRGRTSANNIEQCHASGSVVRNVEHIFEQVGESAAVTSSNCPDQSAMAQAPDDIMLKPSPLCRAEDKLISTIPHSVKENGGSEFPEITCSGDDSVVVLVNQPTYEVSDPNGTSSNMADNRGFSGLPAAVGSSDCCDNATTVSLPIIVASSGSGEYISLSATSSMPDDVVPLEGPQAVSNAITLTRGNTSAEDVQTRSIGACISNITEVGDWGRANSTNIQDSCYQAPEVETSVPSISCKIPMGNESDLPMQVAQKQSSPYDDGHTDKSHDAHITTATGLTTTFPPSTSSDGALINMSLTQEPIAKSVELMQMQNTSFGVHVVASQQSTHEVAASGPPTLSSESQPQDNNEVYRSSRIVQDPMRLSENIQSHPSHNTTSETAKIPISMYPGPLQNELDRIRKEIDCINQLQQDKKLQLESDCEKEIAEVVAQIRQKYKVKYQDIDVEYGTKSKELERHHDKVLMNKILAEAFKSKCMDVRTPSALGLVQDRNSRFRQQLNLHLSSQQTSQCSSAATIPSAGHLTSSLRGTAALYLQHTTPPAVSPMAPSVMGVCHSSAPFVSISPRPAEANHLSPPTNTQLGSEIRTMPPHLQRNRSSSSLSTNRFPLYSRASSNQMSPNTLSVPVFLQPASYVQTRACPTVPYSRSQRSESAVGSPDTPNSSTAAPPDVNSPNMLPQLVHMGSGLAVPIETSTQNRMLETSVTTTKANIVCLSDD